MATEPTLTPREVECLRCVAEGMTNARIAGQLGIALGTVKQHLVNAYAKLDVQSRTAAVLVGWRKGWIR